MSRREIRLAELEAIVADGWHLASFSLVEPTQSTPADAPRVLLADVCRHDRLEDGRIGFYRVVLEPGNEPKDMARIQVLVAIAKAQWARELDGALEHARSELLP
jgi:hypothetical protein